MDIGKFSGMEPTPFDELSFDQWCIDVKSYQTSYPDNVLLPAIRKSIVGKAKSVIRHLGPTCTVDEIINILTQEYEGVASSDVIFKDFYQLKQECNEKVQVFSIQLRDMLTCFSIRFLNRVPKEDHDKILKDRFFYGIKTDLRNSIHHLYDNEAITFSELLVKAHRNEEEDTTSRVVNKGSAIETEGTLEERVDRLIVGATQATNRDNNQNYSRPPFQANQIFQRDNLKRPPRSCPQEDISQNLRSPEPNASGPFEENDGSRATQCFKCRGWGYPKRLCPSQLNYTWGEWYGNLPPRPMEGEPKTLLPPTQIPNKTISQVVTKYHNLDPLLRLISLANEATIIVEGQRFEALIKSGAQLYTISESLVQTLKLPIHQLNTLIKAEVSGGGVVPYIGYVEARLLIPGIKAMDKDTLFMVSNDGPYMKRVPIQLGTLHM